MSDNAAAVGNFDKMMSRMEASMDAANEKFMKITELNNIKKPIADAAKTFRAQ